MVEDAWPLSHRAAVDGGNRAWPCGVGRGGLAGPYNDPSSFVGHRIFAYLWAWNHCRNDADYNGDRASIYLYTAPLCAIESGTRDGFGNAESELRIILVLPDWFRRRAFLKPSTFEVAAQFQESP